MSEHQTSLSNFNRRAVLAGLAATILSSHATAQSGTRVKYGAASMIEDFDSDPKYRQALIDYCDIIVPMNDLKWEAVHPERNRFNFEQADRQLAFAKQHGKTVRGHTLCWYSALPAWTKEITTPKDAEAELIRHIETVTGRYKDQIPSWDVVNEAIAHDPQSQGIWRNEFWHKLLGPRHIEIAFQTAARTAPKAQLVYNDYDLENRDDRNALRRKHVIDLVRNLQSKKIPIHSIGFQAHLYAERPIDVDGIGTFVEDLRKLGVGVMVTELDLIDWRLPGPISDRDRDAARHVETFLTAMARTGQLEAIITWGITDRYSWVSETFKRNDRLKNRPLPLDENYRLKPMMDVIQRLRAGL
jgi:endo-1,4-beta-xylanase